MYQWHKSAPLPDRATLAYAPLLPWSCALCTASPSTTAANTPTFIVITRSMQAKFRAIAAACRVIEVVVEVHDNRTGCVRGDPTPALSGESELASCTSSASVALRKGQPNPRCTRVVSVPAAHARPNMATNDKAYEPADQGRHHVKRRAPESVDMWKVKPPALDADSLVLMEPFSTL
eukprot:CAMPEP_0115854810 /NCGR_PEP_ID=MMETSP0287-20121206/14218_1 /TAXON_ID=412157 /ORGANISM="Chrysochromulina rotalis, Strain UIO044" /LENGTH=176 /DNA_ID=CAMNT_0003308943 /DNA_START=1586 /DNA_END=2116 /DNA_ORIENTATION=-